MASARALSTALLIDAAPLVVIGPIVTAAEGLGYDYCYVSDEGPGTGQDVHVLLGALAQLTSRIRLGPGVTNPYTRHPAVTAAAISALDEISDGRAFLGLGAGGAAPLASLGIDRVAPVKACADLVSIARKSWDHHIDIHWAARGPRMLELGTRVADVMMLNGIAHDDLPRLVATIDETARQTGRRPRLQYAAALVFDEASREGLRIRTAFRLVDSTAQTREAVGVSTALHDQLRETVLADGPGAGASLVDDQLLAKFVIDSDNNPVEHLRSLVEDQQLDGLTVDISDLSSAVSRLTSAAALFAHL